MRNRWQVMDCGKTVIILMVEYKTIEKMKAPPFIYWEDLMRLGFSGCCMIDLIGGVWASHHHHLPQTGKIQEEDGGVLHWFLEILKIIYPTTPNRKFLEISFLREDQNCIEFETRREDGIAFERRKIENGFSGHFGSMKPPKVSPSALPLQIEFKYSRKAIEM